MMSGQVGSLARSTSLFAQDPVASLSVPVPVSGPCVRSTKVPDVGGLEKQRRSEVALVYVSMYVG